MDDSGDNTRVDPLRQTSVTPLDKISSVLDGPDGLSLMIRHTLLVVLAMPPSSIITCSRSAIRALPVGWPLNNFTWLNTAAPTN